MRSLAQLVRQQSLSSCFSMSLQGAKLLQELHCCYCWRISSCCILEVLACLDGFDFEQVKLSGDVLVWWRGAAADRVVHWGGRGGADGS